MTDLSSNIFLDKLEYEIRAVPQFDDFSICKTVKFITQRVTYRIYVNILRFHTHVIPLTHTSMPLSKLKSDYTPRNWYI